MNHLIIFFFLLVGTTIIGQPAPPVSNEAEASELHEAGNALLQESPDHPYALAVALGKYRSSLRRLDSLDQNQTDLINANLRQIRQITNYFSRNSNSDSLLQLTRFYPDSTFQKNPKYADRFKRLIPPYFNYLEKKKRQDFYSIDDLNYIYQKPAAGTYPFVLNFERYWPFEVLELDRELQLRENKLANLSPADREEILYAIYSLKLSKLKNEFAIDSLRQLINNIQQTKAVAEEKINHSQKQADQLIKAGVLIFMLLLLIGLWALRKNKQQLKNINQNLLEEKKRSEELLLNMLPAEIARELKNKAAARAHKYDRVSILFSDFKGFSQIAKNLTPEELVMELDYCFTEFDRIIDKYRLQKIKTIGDAYMCVGGLYTKGTNHVKRMVMAALEIQAFLNNLEKQRTAAGKHFFEARIGIHTGPIVAGVVGTKKFAFDIWGDSVNVAQQMEFHSEVGRVNISGETYEIIKDSFACTYRNKVIIKNMKAFDMYFVDSVLDKKE